MTALDLAEAFSKIEWAEAQFDTVQRDSDAFFKTQPYEPVYDNNLYPGETAVKIKLTADIPNVLKVSVGAIIHSLRSSLDLLAVALARRNSATRTNDVYFPISASASVFRDDGLKKIKRLSAADVAEIENIKPYAGGNDLLFALHKLDTTDKHNQLVAVGGLLQSIGIDDFEGAFRSIPGMENGRLDGTVPLLALKPNANGKIHLSSHIAFSDIGYAKDQPVLPTLHQFADLTKSIIDLF